MQAILNYLLPLTTSYLMGQYDQEVSKEDERRSVNSDTTTQNTSTQVLEQPSTTMGQEIPIQEQAPEQNQNQQNEQQQAPEHVEEGGHWTQDKNEFGQVIYHDSEAAAETRQAILEPLNKWEEYRIHQHEGEGYVVEMQGERTVANFIELVKLVEAAYPDRSTNDIIGSIRGTFSNNGKFRDMMDKEVLAPPIEPVEGILTQEDINYYWRFRTKCCVD